MQASKEPRISVTLSAYNVDLYLRDCLDCIIFQTLQEIEIICVNDGSSDTTGHILKEYAEKDSRIVVIDKEVNEGLAVARNDALALAKGKYVGFVDGDDLLDRDLFRRAYECAEKSQAELLFWDYNVFRDADKLAEKVEEPSSLATIDPSNKLELLNLNAFAWTKLIRTDVAKALNISFPKGLTYQDIPVHWQLVTQLDKIAILPERLSYYRQQPEATTHQSGWKRADLITVMDLVGEYLHENNLYSTYMDFYIRKQLEGFQGVYDVVVPSLQPKVMELIQSRMGEDQNEYIARSQPLRAQTKTFFESLQGSWAAKIQRAAWLSLRRCYRLIRSAR